MPYETQLNIQGGPSSGLEWFAVVLTVIVMSIMIGASIERTRRAIKIKSVNFISLGSILLLALYPVPTIISCLNATLYHTFAFQHFWEGVGPVFSLLYLAVQIEVLAIFQFALRFPLWLRPFLHVLSFLVLIVCGIPYYYGLLLKENLLSNPITTGFFSMVSLFAGFYAYLIILDMVISAVLLVYLIRNISSVAESKDYLLVYQLGTVAVILTILDFIVMYLSFKTGNSDRQFAYTSLIASDMQGIHYIFGTYYLNVFSVLKKKANASKGRRSVKSSGANPAIPMSESSAPPGTRNVSSAESMVRSR